MKLFQKIYSFTCNRCPHCLKGKMFEHENPYQKDGMKMLDHCLVCHQTYMPETGFYYGAMYVSYALTVGFGIVSYLIWSLITPVDTIAFLIYITVALIVLMPVTFRWSRTLWLSIFVKYEKDAVFVTEKHKPGHE
ncbi:MAG: DUF983 domain-containing protein [Bacteroidia bacterium]|nr:DUF983 domain-containing protein [Bacteroidia bacterium]